MQPGYYIGSPKNVQQPKFMNPYHHPGQMYPNQNSTQYSPVPTNLSPLRQPRAPYAIRRLSPPMGLNQRSQTPPFRMREPSNGNYYANTSGSGQSLVNGQGGNSGLRDQRDQSNDKRNSFTNKLNMPQGFQQQQPHLQQQQQQQQVPPTPPTSINNNFGQNGPNLQPPRPLNYNPQNQKPEQPMIQSNPNMSNYNSPSPFPNNQNQNNQFNNSQNNISNNSMSNFSTIQNPIQSTDTSTGQKFPMYPPYAPDLAKGKNYSPQMFKLPPSQPNMTDISDHKSIKEFEDKIGFLLNEIQMLHAIVSQKKLEAESWREQFNELQYSLNKQKHPVPSKHAMTSPIKNDNQVIQEKLFDQSKTLKYIEDLQNQNLQLINEIQKFTNSQNNYESTNIVQESMKVLQKQNFLLQEELRSIKDTNQLYQDQIRVKNHEIMLHKEELTKISNRVKMAENYIEENMQVKPKLISELENRVTSLLSEVERLQNLIKLKDDEKEKNEHRMNMILQDNKLENQILQDQLQSLNDAKNREIQDLNNHLEQHFNELRQENQILANNVNEKDLTINELISKLEIRNSNDNQVANQQQQIKQLQQVLTQRITDIIEWQVKYAALQKDLRDKDDQNDEFKGQDYAMIENENQRLKWENATLKQEQEMLEARMRSLEISTKTQPSQLNTDSSSGNQIQSPRTQSDFNFPRKEYAPQETGINNSNNNNSNNNNNNNNNNNSGYQREDSNPKPPNNNYRNSSELEQNIDNILNRISKWDDSKQTQV